MPAPDPTPFAAPFTGMALDRASIARKDPDWVAGRLEDPRTRVIAAGHDGVLIDGSEAPALLRADTTSAPPTATESVLLGLEDGRALFALDLESGSPDSRNGARLVSLRDAGALLAPSEAGLAAYTVALLNWHRRHRFCANCGAATDAIEGGYARSCPACGASHFPRTDPVVIMTVEHDGRLLLGRRSGWPSGRLSVLAGFISPGESAEEAVVREVHEESGIIARDPAFVGSQPWPFPASLMLGFHAVSDGGEPVATDGELEEVHWIGLDAIRRAVAGEDTGFMLPPSVSVARLLIERWVRAQGG
jgi:NAD+ diphosphatase